MGFFDKLKGGIQFNKMAKAAGAIIEMLDLYEATGDTDLLMKAAWLSRLGMMDKQEQYLFGPTAPMIVLIHGHQERMTLSEAFMRSVGRLGVKCRELTEDEDARVGSILDKEQAFYEVDRQIPYEEKKKYI